MAQSSYPFDGMTTTETQFSNFFRELQETGVAASADSLALKITADAGGMRVFLGTGSAIVRGFFYNNDASLQLTIAAAHATLARVDRVVLRLDPTANSIVAAVITGTPGAGTPAITQSTTGVYELPLATVAVGASVTAIATGNLTDERVFIGRGVTSWTTAQRPASPRKAHLGYNSETSTWEFWSGSAWAPLLDSSALTALGDSTSAHAAATVAHGATGALVGTTNAQTLTNKTLTSPIVTGLTLDGYSVSGALNGYVPSWTAQVTNPSIGNGSIIGQYRRIGNLVYFRIEINIGSTTTGGSGVWRLGLPFPQLAPVNAWEVLGEGMGYDTSAASRTWIRGLSRTSGSLELYDLNLGQVGAGNPWTWAVGDQLVLSGMYPAA